MLENLHSYIVLNLHFYIDFCSKEVIEQLNQRNKALIETINNSKYKEELNIAIMNNYVDKFYLSMKL